MATKPRVCVGMSGGVDSSVAAHLLKKQGFDVVGLTFRGWPQDCRSIEEDKCCGPQAVADARMVAHSLGIPHYVVDEIDIFRREVMDYFAAEYRRGRTPNPCVICNEKVKFGSLLRKAQALGAEMIATGHYARIEKSGTGVPPVRHERNERPGRSFHYQLCRARDRHKDQTYFLFSLNQDQLARSMFPLGEFRKAEVRALAKEIGLKTYGKEESQEVCFVPENDYRRFLREDGVKETKGELVTKAGEVLGHHSGIHNYTIGQREGLKLGGLKKPLYVVALDAANNRVVVGTGDQLMRDQFDAAHCVWNTTNAAKTLDVLVKIRSTHEGCPATVERTSDANVSVKLHEPQRAVTPGQAAVFYQEDVVIGGGWIC